MNAFHSNKLLSLNGQYDRLNASAGLKHKWFHIAGIKGKRTVDASVAFDVYEFRRNAISIIYAQPSVMLRKFRAVCVKRLIGDKGSDYRITFGYQAFDAQSVEYPFEFRVSASIDEALDTFFALYLRKRAS